MFCDWVKNFVNLDVKLRKLLVLIKINYFKIYHNVVCVSLFGRLKELTKFQTFLLLYRAF